MSFTLKSVSLENIKRGRGMLCLQKMCKRKPCEHYTNTIKHSCDLKNYMHKQAQFHAHFLMIFITNL